MKNIFLLFLSALILLCCKAEPQEATTVKESPKPKISLAQWSLHKSFFDGILDPRDFAKVAKDSFGIDAVEYVNQFYVDHKDDAAFWEDMRRRADELGVQSLLIMVDGEGILGAADKSERDQAVENHKGWVDAAAILGCHSIRVNAFGPDNPATYLIGIVDGLKKLCDYAATKNINIIIENHGLFSSDGQMMVDMISGVNRTNIGTLPDFGNWCSSKQWGGINGPCEIAYDMYQGVKDFMPYAKGVSAKTYDFDANGNDTRIDYKKMIDIVKSFDFDGYIGVEYEGSELSEYEGIRMTKALIEASY